MIFSALKNNRGIALLITLTMISVMVVITLELKRKVLATVISSAASRDRITLLHRASSAIQVGMALLILDKNGSDIDSLQEDWAQTAKIDALLTEFLFDSGSLKLKISDELAKIQVNALVSFPEGQQFNPAQLELWQNFLENYKSILPDPENLEPVAVINAIKDWLDSGDDDAITGLTGAESPYYQSLDPPYPPKNGPVDHVGELRLVKGMTPALLAGDNQIPGLHAYLSAYGLRDLGGNTFTYDGKININTADVAVIAALLPPDGRDLAPAIVEYRQEIENSKYIHDLSSPTWYKGVPGAADMEINPDLITTASDVFRLEATARLQPFQETVIAVVRREKDASTGRWFCRILNWQAN